MAYQYEAGFIGAGNMGGALARAAVKTVGGAAVAVACSTAEHSAALRRRQKRSCGRADSCFGE